MFYGVRRVKYLYLYRNKITSIESGVFQGMQYLQQLYLHVNEIHSFDPLTFSNLPQLERLFLHHNNLKTIPLGSFSGLPKLQKLRLDSNALKCDCSMVWFVKMINEHSVMTVAATCYEPSGAAGMPLAAMKESDFQCKKPEFQKEPEDILVDFGQNALFVCSATGEPAPEIIWYRDATVVSLERSRYEIMENGSLMVHEADENDIGIFECKAKNSVGEVRSKPAKMMVHSQEKKDGFPIFTILPRKQEVRINQPLVRFDCTARGNPEPHISWLFNGEKMLLSDRVTMRHNGSIFIENVDFNDSGNYTCEAENILGKISSSGSLEVMVPPAFIMVPKDQTAALGDTVYFTCTARGVPKPQITWYRNTMILPPDESIILSDNNQNLTITEISGDDDGIYHCRAENSEGLTEISAFLKVEQNKIIVPKIVLRPEDLDAFEETSVQLPCEYESEPPGNVEWRKNGNRLTTNDRFSITIIGSLVIKNITLADSGSYECSVHNEYGRDTAAAFLTVKNRVVPGEEYINIALTQATRDVDQAIARTVEELFNNKRRGTSFHELYRISRFPDASARDIAKAADIYDRALYIIREYMVNDLNVTVDGQFNYENFLSKKLLDVIATLSGCVVHREAKDCSDMCYHTKYRSIDGSCNNLESPTWGSSLTAFRRILFAQYENGFSQPIGWNVNHKYNGYTLPSSRLVSTTVITTKNITQSEYYTHMLMQWGQWLDHDLDHALPSVSSQTWDGVDCKKTCDYAPPCFPIEVPQGDLRITNRRCIDFIRTSAVCGSGMTSVLFENLQAREQINQLTSFIDASQVYGYEKNIAEDLRDLTNDNGTLRVGAKFPGRKPLLPTTGLNAMDCRLNLEESTRSCFVAGDIRANEQIGLAVMHTIFMREHNRIATELKTLNPFWDGDRLYQEARKIVGAEMQIITYRHWLPIILGREGYSLLGEYTGYDPYLNPSISNVFATAALRFGHSIINPILNRYDENFETIPQGHLLLRDAFFSPWRLVDEGGVDPLLRGMFVTPAKLKTPTQNLNSELTEKLFYSAHAVALDLAAMNIQRGRDHGIPAYTKWRDFCNMTEVNSFDDLANEISDPSVRAKLKDLYGSVFNIDVWVGGILEDQVEGGMVGPLFRCLLIEQFQRLRSGDRFWYENPSTFKSDQLRELKLKTNLARIICDNADNIDTINQNVFVLPEIQEGLMSCDDLPKIDLRYWMDCKTCHDNFDLENNRVRRDIGKANLADQLKENEFMLEDLQDSVNILRSTVKDLRKKVEELEMKINKK
ncbi:peroxidasin-like [Leptidea sinapis]|uniref:peroxidasin-like n=1 Tax=Leptidea sinapis TaxID=189913 RepID=UPI0021C3E618|nr:peroxidasin-like [Leptidea sinapis]